MAPLQATTLSVDGAPLAGVEITGANYSGDTLNITLSNSSNNVEAAAPGFPDIPGPSTDDLCGNTAQVVTCVSSLGLLQDRVSSDSLELSAGVVASSEFLLSTAVNPTLVVLEFRASSSILPVIDGYISAEPGGSPISSDCSFELNGYVGGRIYLSHDGSSADFQSRFCTLVRGERFFLNLNLSGTQSGSPLTIFRTVRLSGI